MAHLLEHLIFKGFADASQGLGPVREARPAANGSTSFDRTNFTASFGQRGELDWYVGWPI